MSAFSSTRERQAARMAALHLLPRELVHLLASRPAAAPQVSHRLSGLLHSHGLPRFSSDYRRVALDSETARDFDRPSKGYDYPSIGDAGDYNFLDEASFVEPDDAEYHVKFSLSREPRLALEESEDAQHTIHRTVMGTRALTPNDKQRQTALSDSRRAMLALGNAANCLQRNDLDSAVAWFIDAPKVPVSFANQQQRLQSLVNSLTLKLMENRPQDIPLLMAFATSAASKGCARQLLRLIPHISRFSSYDRLEPFWKQLFTEVQASASSRHSESSPSTLDPILSRLGNRIIRSLFLSEDYSGALKFLELLRAQVHRLPEQGKPAIESETYRIFLEEIQRRTVDPSIYGQVDHYRKADHPELFSSSPSESKSASPTLDVKDALPKRSSLQDDAIDLLPSAKPVTPKSEYARITEMIYRGESVDQQEVAAFASLCNESDTAYLYRALKRKLAVSSVEREYRRLKTQMTEGRLPQVKSLAAFINHCRDARQPELALKLDIWMGKQEMRFKSLWMLARMYRLVHRGDKQGPQEALRFYKKHFMHDGLPAPILEYFKSLPDTYVEKEYVQLHLAAPVEGSSLAIPEEAGFFSQARYNPVRSRLPASSHGIAMAIHAWLKINPREENIMETYRSFIRVSYTDKMAVRTPAHLMPDQVSFGPFLKYLTRIGKSFEALNIAQGMRERGVMPNAHNWATVAGGFAREGNRKMVAAILTRMREAALPVPGKDRRTTQSQHLASEGTVQEAQPTRKQTRTQSLTQKTSDASLEGFTFHPPSIVTYVTIIRGLLLAGDVDKAKDYSQAMFVARGASGERLYRFGENPKAEAALDIMLNMGKLAEQGRRSTTRRGIK